VIWFRALQGAGDFSNAMDKTNLAKIQEELAQKVIIPPDNSGYRAKAGDMVFSLDAQYVDDQAYVGLDVRKWNGQIVGTYVGVANIDMPYVPHFFCFREGPPLLRMIRAVQDRLAIGPDLILVDGHGVAHPRRFGLACWIGVQTGPPCIGCAKEALIWYAGIIEKKRGKMLRIQDQGEVVGAVLVTQDNANPVFVSPGHNVGVGAATEIILRLTGKYRICEPLRRAEQSARAYAKGAVLEEVTPMGELDVQSY